ncbi:Rrf2 family transcriptional regulator [Roseomonas sp. NAR14]|uniref:Rrf2 family transcriptional regulator n=1 Tax=Roseomonas acroporae TaxID=2937791 RepID=A0A9X1Y5U7_9PROT|nr:Rrf2 family transcriptional regulator [Roseomonas acroporae]MCK8784041.1 Rrf2 family transcriptional regulator [Roseomonas acroporae]
MRLTVYTDYSLRMLIHLAAKEGELATIGEVAAAYGISQHHLTKVAHRLGVAGFVTTVRGKGGGLRLGRPAAAIRLGEVVRHTEPDMALVPCLEIARHHAAAGHAGTAGPGPDGPDTDAAGMGGTATDDAEAGLAAPGHGVCRIAPACRLRGVLVEARQAFLAVLDRYTLADLACQPAVLRALLDLPEPAARGAVA